MNERGQSPERRKVIARALFGGRGAAAERRVSAEERRFAQEFVIEHAHPADIVQDQRRGGIFVVNENVDPNDLTDERVHARDILGKMHHQERRIFLGAIEQRVDKEENPDHYEEEDHGY